MTHSKTRKQGEELNQLSRLMFDRAATLWAWSLFLEALAGVMGIFVGLIVLSPDWKVVSAIFTGCLAIGSYILRISFTRTYDDAETMRRQSVLAEALCWPIGATEFSRWRQKAGRKTLKSFKLKSRDENYYQTKEKSGPKRLLEMTIESAFYTRHVYAKVKSYLWVFCTFLSLLFVVTLSLAPLESIPPETRLDIVYRLYLVLPLLISIDLLGWALRLENLVVRLTEIEKDMESLHLEGEPQLEHVMRLVSEYNCQVVNGFPVLNILFRLWHDEINELWEYRKF